eukprot:TRINITY_DN7775_c0_g5_i1.p1 TRINITY_DN7775_c0_g5~~TRINITY_DN7775_c0_g5_i1.p1  ORF type:complete len:466 (+),score=143.51 TRINITY_DN7775_c0_g5_i1:702-2099(+)
MSRSNSVSSEDNRKETPFANYLKQRVSELEAEKDWWKKECLQMRKQAYNKYWSKSKETGEESKKPSTRGRPTGQKQTYVELQEQVLDQRVLIKELNERIRELTIELEKVKDSESQTLEELNKAKARGKQIRKRKQKIKQQERTIEKARERMNVLLLENKELHEKLEEANEDINKETQDKVSNENIDQLSKRIERLKKEKSDQANVTKQISKSLLDKDREIREIISRAKENEDRYILERLEEKERLEARIVRLELQLKAKEKEQPEENPKPHPLTEIDTSVRRTIKPLVQEADLLYPKQMFIVAMIKEKKDFNEIKRELFTDYEADEKISIKELIKIFKRKPLQLKNSMAEGLARYLIEPRDVLEVIYNIYADKLIGDIRILLDNFVSLEYPANFWADEATTERAIKKLHTSMFNIRIKARDGLSFTKWMQICKEECPELNGMERDFTVALMADKDLDELDFGVLV